ncbi:VOC family protein [Antrihabitans cavernicola]|uniref:VOC family protein n=1 Tax=Antrihabitans cavernicola TaxID=2495913 RepID=A0A5A7SKQ8_9NOCA|nr:VOC family protein [Spelaeibacter cavernicola]KAA0024811.1 VOC family protein [Spelaeibacter cavernicola]
MDWTLEVVNLPVTDVDRAIEFYRDNLGFHLDHDIETPLMRVIQLTPTGSGCSIVLSQQEQKTDNPTSLQLVVSDAYAARAELAGRGVEVSEMTVFDEERDASTFFHFADSDGNRWAVQQIAARATVPLAKLLGDSAT